MCLGFVFVAPINDSYVYYRSRMRTGTPSLYLESICSMTFNHFPFSTLQHAENEWTLITVRIKPISSGVNTHVCKQMYTF